MNRTHKMTNIKQELEELLRLVIERGASDLHISVGRKPTLRIDGTLVLIEEKDVIDDGYAERFVMEILKEDQRARFLENKELDFSYNFEDIARFRVNVFMQKGKFAAAMRLIPTAIRTLDELGHPPILHNVAKTSQGFFLVVGPTGHGKTTTLAAMIDIINRERAEHIITVEDPIEYLFTQDKSLIDQREVGSDTRDFHSALRSMFRQDVNVAMIGEMRDPETMAAAVTAAETGHLVFSSLHTNNAAQTIDRIIDSFPAAQQNQIRSQLSSTLLGIFSQRLVPRVSGGLIPAYELLIANTDELKRYRRQLGSRMRSLNERMMAVDRNLAREINRILQRELFLQETP